LRTFAEELVERRSGRFCYSLLQVYYRTLYSEGLRYEESNREAGDDLSATKKGGAPDRTPPRLRRDIERRQIELELLEKEIGGSPAGAAA